jgi:hypothetical protein
MLSHLLSFVVMGIVQLALTVYGEYLAIKSLPPGEKRRPHLLGIGGLGCLAVASARMLWLNELSVCSKRTEGASTCPLRGPVAFKETLR